MLLSVGADSLTFSQHEIHQHHPSINFQINPITNTNLQTYLDEANTLFCQLGVYRDQLLKNEQSQQFHDQLITITKISINENPLNGLCFEAWW